MTKGAGCPLKPRIRPSVAPLSVMAGLGPAIHDFFFPVVKIVDARHKAGHDEECDRLLPSLRGCAES